MNVIARLEYELAYYDSAVHHFNHYTTRTPLNVSWRYVIPTDDTATTRATFFQVGVTSPHNISLMGRIYNCIIFKWRNWCYICVSMCVYVYFKMNRSTSEFAFKLFIFLQHVFLTLSGSKWLIWVFPLVFIVVTVLIGCGSFKFPGLCLWICSSN